MGSDWALNSVTSVLTRHREKPCGKNGTGQVPHGDRHGTDSWCSLQRRSEAAGPRVLTQCPDLGRDLFHCWEPPELWCVSPEEEGGAGVLCGSLQGLVQFILATLL